MMKAAVVEPLQEDEMVSMANNAVESGWRFDNTNRRALTIPLDTCTRFAIFPLTWLCHLGFTICGSEGHISDTPNGQEIADYRPMTQ
jgi:hypothetical protein